MKKSLLFAGLMALGLMVASAPAYAADNSKVTFTADEKVVYDGGSSQGMITPGEAYVKTIVLDNQNARTVDFYMNTQVVNDLDDNYSEDDRAGYDVTLTIDDKVVYDSKLGGNGAKTGLKGMNDALGTNILVSTLKSGSQSTVKLEILFDGEGFDKAKYAGAVANLQFNYEVAYEEPTGITTRTKVVTEKGETRYLTVTGSETATGAALSAQTGDSLVVPAIIAGVLVLGLVLILIGKKKKAAQKVTTVAAIVALSFFAFGIEAKAEEQPVPTYTVTFRPGKVGHFEGVDNSGNVLSGEAYANALYGADNVEVTKLGAFKVTYEAGETLGVVPSVKADGEYVVDTKWAPSVNTLVTKDSDFVADYVALVNGVEYTVRYEDATAEGKSISASYTTIGNVGETVTITPPATITVSDAARYFLAADNTYRFVLDEDSSKNIFVIRYTMEGRGENVETVTEYTEGDVVTTVIPAAPVAAPAVAVPGVAAPGPAPAQGEVVEAPENAAEEETLDIADEGTPQAAGEVEEGTEGEENAMTEIAEEKTPLSNAGETVLWPYFVAAGVVIAAVVILLIVNAKKKKDGEEAEAKKEEK